MTYPHRRNQRKVRVRCLGPGKEHTFLSVDPKRNRVCEQCQAAMKYAMPMMKDERKWN